MQGGGCERFVSGHDFSPDYALDTRNSLRLRKRRERKDGYFLPLSSRFAAGLATILKSNLKARNALRRFDRKLYLLKGDATIYVSDCPTALKITHATKFLKTGRLGRK